MILLLLAVPTACSVTSHVVIAGVHYRGWEIRWIIGRIALPLTLIVFPGRTVQRVGLGGLNILPLTGLFR